MTAMNQKGTKVGRTLY